MPRVERVKRRADDPLRSNLAESFTCGNGASGTGRSSSSQIGSQPSAGRPDEHVVDASRGPRRCGAPSRRASAASSAVRRAAAGRSGPTSRASARCSSRQRRVDAARARSTGRASAVAVEDAPDRLAHALRPRVARPDAEQHLGLRVGLVQLAIEVRARPVDGGLVAREDLVPVGRRRRTPSPTADRGRSLRTLTMW